MIFQIAMIANKKILPGLHNAEVHFCQLFV